MPRLRTTTTAVFGLLVAILTPTAGAQTAVPTDTTMPTTGLDFSGVDQFWKIVDVLLANGEPAEDQWRALLATPGYRLAERSIGRTVRRDIELAFKPARRAEFDSLTTLANDQASRLKHLRRALSQRAELVTLRDSLPRAFPIAEALRLAQQFLPPGRHHPRRPTTRRLRDLPERRVCAGAGRHRRSAQRARQGAQPDARPRVSPYASEPGVRSPRPRPQRAGCRTGARAVTAAE